MPIAFIVAAVVTPPDSLVTPLIAIAKVRADLKLVTEGLVVLLARERGQSEDAIRASMKATWEERFEVEVETMLSGLGYSEDAIRYLTDRERRETSPLEHPLPAKRSHRRK